MKQAILLMLLVLLPVPAALAADSAEFQEYTIHNLPLVVGVPYTLGLGFTNTGDTAWTSAGGYGLEIVEGIGSNCTGTELSPGDSVLNGQVASFELSCIPLPDEVDKTTIRVQMEKSGVPFGESRVIDVFTVENDCRNNAVDGTCNKYCGADDRCHGYRQNDINKDGFCNSSCSFMDSPPAGWETTTTMSTTTTKKTTTTTEETTTTTGTTLSTTTTTLGCSLTEGLRDDGVCSISCGASAYCDKKQMDVKGCLNCGTQLCGNGLVDAGEMCDTKASSSEWKCELFLCNGPRSMGFKACGGECQCSYYEETCMSGRCGAECGGDSECNDYNPLTEDNCNISSCRCTFALITVPGKGEGPEAKGAGLNAMSIAIAGLALVAGVLLLAFITKGRKKVEKAK